MSIRLRCAKKFTEVDNIFIDEYMTQAVPVFSLIYIYALRMATEEKTVTNEEIADKFSILESDVIKAWKFWKKMGLVKMTGTKDDVLIEFTAVKSKLVKKEKPVEEISAAQAAATVATPVKTTVANEKPVYNPSQIEEIITANPEITDLLQMAELSLNKVLSSNDVSMIVGFYEWLKLPMDVIAVLLTYCGKNGKSMRYMEKTAIDWAEREIKNADEAEAHLNYFANEYKEVLQFFGVHNRAANKEEQRLIQKWIKNYGYTMQMIKIACDKTIANTGQVSFAYADKIIENWYKSGIKTAEAVEIADARHKQSGGNVSVKSNSFNSYEQRDYEEDELEEIIKRKNLK
jgi:DnaD/phage-associated family protein